MSEPTYKEVMRGLLDDKATELGGQIRSRQIEALFNLLIEEIEGLWESLEALQ